MIFSFQGERGSFSEAAARKLLGAAIDVLPCRTFEEAFASVADGRADAGILPIENTLAGSIHRNYELLGEAGLEIAGEVRLRIGHSLIARPGAKLEEIRKVHSHPVALAQCQRFLAEHPAIEAVAEYDTAGSVGLVMERGRSDEAAIAGEGAAAVYGGEILASGIEDHHENYTRFLALALPANAPALRARMPEGELKTTVLFRLPDRAGALFRALAVFALRDINLSKLESRPIAGRPWEYVFYADVAGGIEDAPLANALGNLREMCETVQVLGSYPAAR